MIHSFSSKTYAVTRLETVSGNRKALLTVTSADGNTQNIDTRQANVVEGVASKTYMTWFDIDMDIQKGDILRDRDTSRRYRVIGVEKQGQGMGLMSEHLEVVMQNYTS